MKAKLKSFLGAILLGVSTTLFSADASHDLFEALQKMETFKAHFVQKIHDANGEHVGKSEGEIMVRRPGKFYWKSQLPDPILVVADGNVLWTYDIDLSQVTKQQLKEALANSPAAILAGSLDTLKENFDISNANKNLCPKSDACYTLKPKQKDAPFADIQIGFAKGKLTEVRMRDPLGQDVYTLFSKIFINEGVQDKVFAFKPPKGVDIIQAGN